MDFSPFFSAFVSTLAVGSAVAGLVAVGTEGIRNRLRKRKPEITADLPTKIELVAMTTRELSRLNAEIQAEFEAQLIETRRLQDQAAEAQRVAALNADAVKAVEAVAETALGKVYAKQTRKDRRFTVVMTVLGFAGGSIVTFFVTLAFAPHA